VYPRWAVAPAIADWNDVLSRTTCVEVTVLDSLSFQRPVPFTINAPTDLTALRGQLGAGTFLAGYCLCMGEFSLALFDDTQTLLAKVTVHHDSHLRATGWPGDAVLAKKPGLEQWLRERAASDRPEQSDA
jgi:hypothetical protein